MSATSPSPHGLSAAGFPHVQPVVRPERPQDREWIERLQTLAFGPGRFARAAFRVRERIAPDPDLARVAEIDGVPVSAVSMTPISLSGVYGYLLGPLATDPLYRNRGAGRLLVREVCAAALERPRARFVLLVGDHAYYGPLGFAPTRQGAIVFPGPVDPARILAHARDVALAGTLHGTIAPFGAGG